MSLKESSQPIEKIATCALPTSHGNFRLSIWLASDGIEILTMEQGDLSGPEPVFIRIHSQCFTSEALGSLRCDCRPQLENALERINQLGRGLLIYLQQEGRGIGLANKVKAYALQDKGVDTVDANHILGFENDLRDFTDAGRLIQQLGIEAILLNTNNPSKIEAIRNSNIDIREIVPSVSKPNPHNTRYLQTKARRMGHTSLESLDYTSLSEL